MSEPNKPRYLTQAEVARQLGYRSSGSVRNLIAAKLLVGVKMDPTNPKSGVRVTRESFEAYCARIEAEAEAARLRDEAEANLGGAA